MIWKWGFANMKIYRTSLELRFPVYDLEEAQKYLSENNMTKY